MTTPTTSADPGLVARVRANLEDVRGRIEAACRRAGRSPGEVALVGVTKYAGIEEARALAAAGVRELGENRAHEGGLRRRDLSGLPSEASAKEGEIRWHMIGHLQSNKAKRALGWMDVLHSLDRPSLAGELEKTLAKEDRNFPAYVQVNVSGEKQKGGARPEDLEGWVRDLRASHPHLDLQGLMTMAPYGAAADDCRAMFRKLRELRDACGVRGLSMGMSGDFEIAVEEGATLVRVGRALVRQP